MDVHGNPQELTRKQKVSTQVPMSDDPTPTQMAYDTFSTIYPEAFKCTVQATTCARHSDGGRQGHHQGRPPTSTIPSSSRPAVLH